MKKPGMRRELKGRYEDVLAQLPEVLKAEGFGVLTEVDVRETLKKKLDVDFRRYKILGACNPTLAHEALGAELDLGVLLPCNVTVYEADDGTTVVNTVDPLQSIGAFADGDERILTVKPAVRVRESTRLEPLGPSWAGSTCAIPRAAPRFASGLKAATRSSSKAPPRCCPC